MHGQFLSRQGVDISQDHLEAESLRPRSQPGVSDHVHCAVSFCSSWIEKIG